MTDPVGAKGLGVTHMVAYNIPASRSSFAQGALTKGKDYTGQWSVEGDAMCFAYEGTPKTCWNVELNGDQVGWIKNGASQGTGRKSRMPPVISVSQ